LDDRAEMTTRIWLDVEDIFEYAAFNSRPTGIQRLQYELCRALVELDPPGERMGFLRHDPANQSFQAIGWSSVAAVFERLSGHAQPSGPASVQSASVQMRDEQPAGARLGFRRLVYRMPARLRQPLVRYLVQQREAVSSLGAFLRACVTGGLASSQGSGPAATPALRGAESFEARARPGDVVLVLGAMWFHPGHADLIRGACHAKGLRFAVLIYDIIPLRRPEWCERGLVRIFGAWFGSIIGLADHILSISQSSAREIEEYAAQHGITLRDTVRVIPIGTGFEKASAPPPALARPLPEAGTYALIVSTLEIRKNHALLFRVWRRLLDELPRERVPTLVFAGRVGWMVADLMQQLRNSDFLGGKVVLVEDPSDAELERLYQGCLFTLFPSFHEGWGLPVTESLAFGRPCIISNATSLPEAGGALARYFDPDNATEATGIIRDVLLHPEAIPAWHERVVREFRPVPWRDTAEAVLGVLTPAG
jgi:glycosyltransferase involved in cell wall biosynthesis